MPDKLRVVILHVLGILAFLSIPVFTSPDFHTEQNLLLIAGFKRNMISYFLLLIFFYANYYNFIPQLYFTKKILLYLVLLIVSYSIIAIVPALVIPQHMMNMPPPDFGAPNDFFIHPNELFAFPQGSSIVQFFLVLSLSFLLKINSQLTEANNEKLKAEVSYLKAQINPHFLFNTLNSLYALTIQKSDAAPDAVIKLSNMMRYVVTESTNDLVLLEKEIDYITDYIAMEKLRITDESKLKYTIIGNPKGKTIAPLVIIPFIENAFKYGINAEENWQIAIALEITGNEFTLDVKNNKVSTRFSELYAGEKGIENAQKRLDFIYPGEHDLAITEDAKQFHIHLKINLS